MPPVLLYHGTPQLHAEAGGEQRMAAVRFGSPVRLASLRIIPDGVECPDGSVGATSPAEFTLDVLLNVSPSDPVNALARTSCRVVSATHALDYPIDMPQGTTTRLVILRAPAQSITLSLYAHDTEDSAEAAKPEAVAEAPPTQLHLPRADKLLASLPSMRGERRVRALHTLGVLARTELDLANVLASPAAESLVETDDAETSDDEDAATDAAIASILGLEDLSTVPPRTALRALLALPDAPWATAYPLTEAPLAIALQLASAQRLSGHPKAGSALATTLQRLLDVLDGASVNGPTASLLARTLPPLAAASATLGHTVDLPQSMDARTVLRALLASSAETTYDGRACAPSAAILAAPFLAQIPHDDPLRRAWDTRAAAGSAPCPPPSVFSATPSPLPVTGSLPISPNPAAQAGTVPTLQVEPPPATSAPGMPPLAPPPARINPHTVSRVTRALDAGSHSLDLRSTPAEILAAVAPDLLASLSTARTPPLGIPASRAAHGSASDYAGKVYSAHEFRRERETVSGLGVGASSAGRKASRHVDDFRA